ncbi:MAG: electron transport complex subunit E [Deltaproteobacteria bacterium]|nr:electron transport complex subunit E [Deltaproteobacteria bacterium]MBW2171669.1 electron transport complex subunit E [Deltaproteobacteria bacterium]MBW2259652.1 electron transport complex subunit E [Deltaproteobacteria bacterium]
MAKTIVQEFTKGLWEEIPPFRLVLGLCPVLAVTKSVANGVGMGVAATFVLVCSNILVSMLRKSIPGQVRVPCFIIIIATFVVVVELVMQAFTYPLFLQLGIFIPLIVVNCIILGRAEAFAFKNGVVASTADGLGIGVGFTIALAALAGIREVFGAGTISIPFSDTVIQVFGPSFQPFTFMVEAPGAFVCLGLVLAIMNLVGK